MKPLLKVETYTSESLPHEPVITNNMLNSIKTWQDKFEDKYLKVLEGNEELKTNDVINLLLNIKQFISDLRKKDEQQLLLKLSLETRYYGREIEMKISKIIEEYYAK